MKKNQISKKVYSLISEGEIKEALLLLAIYVEGIDKKIENDISILIVFYNKNSRDISNGLISQEECDMANAKLIDQINRILERVPEDGNAVVSSGESDSNVEKGLFIDETENEGGLESTSTKQVKAVGAKFVHYKVFYGTNRLPSTTENSTLKYKMGRDKKLNLGLCAVSIPLSHTLGKIERPNWFGKLFFRESPEKHFTILRNEKLEESLFIELMKQKLESADDKDVLLFIHGFNVKFDEAMMRAAQLGYDLNFKGAVTAFSWPSFGTIGGYIADIESANLSSKYLSAFIKTLIAEVNPNKLFIIAHSMGNVVLTASLKELRNEGVYPNALFNQIILAAPDLDKDIFLDQIMPAIRSNSSLTLYASDKDNALIAAQKIRKGYSRLGEGGNNLVIVDGLDSVDASSIDTSLLGHGYFSDTKSLINDIHSVLVGLRPDKRILEAKSKVIDGISKSYWLLRNE